MNHHDDAAVNGVDVADSALALVERPEEVDEDDEVDVRDADDADDADGTEAAEPATGENLWRRRVWRGLAALGALAVGAALVFLAWAYLAQRSEEARSTQVLDVSREYLAAMASFDYTNLDANHQLILDNSTPEFAAKYDEMVKALRDIVVAGKGVATATAPHVAVERIGKDSATVVGFVDQQVTNVTAPEGNGQKYRMVVELVLRGDKWLVNDVKTV